MRRVPASFLAVAALLASSPAALAAQGAQPATTAASATPADVPAAKLPAAREIIDRYVKAVGGREQILKHASRRETGTVEIPAAGITGQIVGVAAKPNRTATTMTIPGLGETRQGFDGAVAWSIDPMSGPRVLAGKELAQRRAESDFYDDLHDPKTYTSIETVDLVDFEGAKAYRVRLTRATGDTTFELFDPSTGLMVGSVATQQSPMGALVVTTVRADYKSFGGIMMPTHVTQKLPTGQQVTFTRSTVEFDAVPPSAFELPPEIKALAAGGAGEQKK